MIFFHQDRDLTSVIGSHCAPLREAVSYLQSGDVITAAPSYQSSKDAASIRQGQLSVHTETLERDSEANARSLITHKSHLRRPVFPPSHREGFCSALETILVNVGSRVVKAGGREELKRKTGVVKKGLSQDHVILLCESHLCRGQV